MLALVEVLKAVARLQATATFDSFFLWNKDQELHDVCLHRCVDGLLSLGISVVSVV